MESCQPVLSRVISGMIAGMGCGVAAQRRLVRVAA
jgi:hypothetical protein